MRLFVALNLPDAVRTALWDAAAPLRDAGLPINWVRPEGMHVTLKFLGEVAESRTADLQSALGRACAGARTLSLGLEGFGAFPDARRPRVVWAGVVPEPALELLQHGVERELAPLGFPTEARAFRPHVTLGRAKGRGAPKPVAGLDAALESLAFAERALVATLDLMQSRTPSGRGGPVYHAIHRERLV